MYAKKRYEVSFSTTGRVSCRNNLW